MTPTIGDFDLDTLHASEGCPNYDALANPELSAPGNNPFPCCTLDTHYTFDPNTNVVDWIGNARDNVTIEWDWSEGGPCGVPPNNSSARLPPRPNGRGAVRRERAGPGERTSAFAPSSCATWRSGAARSSRAEKALKPAGGPADTEREL